MKKLILSFLLTLTLCFPAFALLVTDNTDKDNFQYEVAYQFSSSDLAASLTAAEIPIISGAAQHNFYYTIPRSGKIVGLAVAGNGAGVTTGGATFDVVINGNVTGVQAVVEDFTRSAIGNAGSSGVQYAYMRQDRADTRSHQGFRVSSSTVDKHDSEHPYGKATALSAGNRVGVKVTTSSNFSPTATDYVVTVYVLE